MNKPPSLLAYRSRDIGMTVAQIIYRHTADKVQIVLPIRIEHMASFAPVNHERLPCVGVHQVLLGFLNQSIHGVYNLMKEKD